MAFATVPVETTNSYMGKGNKILYFGPEDTTALSYKYTYTITYKFKNMQ